ncbi:MAG: molybdenum cofactor biosynthesis protein MoaE [Chloroflexi bacterium]|nr:molybdenum cofactor biosynthesis protein MoaE [Chloroflexota bacterium]
MQVRIRLFAQLRELMGGDLREDVSGNRITVAELHRHLERTYPALEPYLPTLAVAINEEYCLDAATEIGPGDEVALIQPISGGAEAPPAPRYLITAEPLDRDALRELVATDASGAVVLFEGVVRDHHEGRAVARLEYEAYAPMAERQMAAVGDEVLAEYADREVHQIAAHHRIGMLEIGDVSLLVAVSAAHRGDAFEAALRAVDRIKETVPVWKREHGVDGSMWQEGVSPRPEGAEHLAGT